MLVGGVAQDGFSAWGQDPGLACCWVLGLVTVGSCPQAWKQGLWYSSLAGTQAQFMGILEGMGMSSPGPGEKDPGVSLWSPDWDFQILYTAIP